jgi:DNA-binding transcriptional ArsR family regulator/rhodanese-related sulfurtransferase
VTGKLKRLAENRSSFGHHSNIHYIVFMSTKQERKSLLYEQVARIGKSLSSPKRLEILDLLAQGEMSVETLATEGGIDNQLTSAHLKALREARLVTARRDGKYMYYRLSSPGVAHLCMTLRDTAEEHLLELREALAQISNQPETLVSETREELLEKVRKGEIIVIDVRPSSEYSVTHLPYARSMPLQEIEQRLAELPRDKEIVAYCRGPFCLLSEDAVEVLSARGFRVRRLLDGVCEWEAAGLPLEHGKS